MYIQICNNDKLKGEIRLQSPIRVMPAGIVAGKRYPERFLNTLGK
jgi:hypothetical protein